MSVSFASGTNPPRRSPLRENTFVSPPSTHRSSPSPSELGFTPSTRVRRFDDPERQPLISTSELGRRRTYVPIVLSVLGLVIFGILVGFGGWKIGKGEGGGRWPGGPY
ncbi:hypothetical protein M231_07431 [Tremella mesenterica]|uniref:Uncharacterized protein n=1 Tax=Tremella mesenterica TaxID=5217 RepID=A0A4Q1B984_TREME|nr:uncharacterized protein TREMEDRAFT_60548 [Tremella mesenterica DSM 1558]EIW71625.1 hypothetical protein TREMEDRAFT_60548 [Tremella mesenterica DSM 1558]RXK35328.1 hypothetical protein M231_07431 [Tremella mesenterica]